LTALPSLDQLRQRLAQGVPPGHADEEGARRQWWGALAVLQDQLLEQGCAPGLWLAAPLPALHEPELLKLFQGWIWTPAPWGQRPPELPGQGVDIPPPGPQLWCLPLGAHDGTDPFLLLLSGPLQVAMALHGDRQRRQLLVRFEPALLAELLQMLGSRLQYDNPMAARALQQQLEALGPLANHPQAAERFWPQLAERLAGAAPSLTLLSAPASAHNPGGDQLDLLEALAHEVRTPLATIRTLIRSLMRRRELPPVVQKRLGQIDAECSEQIDRFGLIFHAAELQRRPAGDRPLARTDLAALLPQLSPTWERQLERRQLQLELIVAQGLPAVMSDPGLLEKMLGGLMDRFSRNLRQGTLVQVELQAAGDRLKLRFSSVGRSSGRSSGRNQGQQSPGPGAAVGPVLSWDPATGSLQLSPQATQQLFASLGGRYTERQGSNLTVYLPVAPFVEGCEESGGPSTSTQTEC